MSLKLRHDNALLERNNTACCITGILRFIKLSQSYIPTASILYQINNKYNS